MSKKLYYATGSYSYLHVWNKIPPEMFYHAEPKYKKQVLKFMIAKHIRVKATEAYNIKLGKDVKIVGELKELTTLSAIDLFEAGGTVVVVAKDGQHLKRDPYDNKVHLGYASKKGGWELKDLTGLHGDYDFYEEV